MRVERIEKKELRSEAARGSTAPGLLRALDDWSVGHSVRAFGVPAKREGARNNFL